MSDRHWGERDRKARGVEPQTLMGQIEQFCARCNDGLALFAVVLAVVVMLTAVVRVPELLAQGLAAQGLAAEADMPTSPSGDWAY